MATATQSGMTSGTHRRRKPGMTSWRPFTRRAEWAIAFAIALAFMLAGGGVVLWTIYSKSRLPSITNLGVALVVLYFVAFSIWRVVDCASLFLWLSSVDHPPHSRAGATRVLIGKCLGDRVTRPRRHDQSTTT